MDPALTTSPAPGSITLAITRPKTRTAFAAWRALAVLAAAAIFLALSILESPTLCAQQSGAWPQGSTDQAGDDAQQPYVGSAAARQPLAAGQLEQLVAPIALYPDALVAQVLAAATYPQQVADPIAGGKHRRTRRRIRSPMQPTHKTGIRASRR